MALRPMANVARDQLLALGDRGRVGAGGGVAAGCNARAADLAAGGW
jgi:hypothetical protein